MILLFNGRFSSKGLKHHNAKPPDVTVEAVLFAVDAFWRHIGNSAHEGGELGVGLVGDGANPEVRNLHFPHPVYQDVLRLDVPVDDLIRMQVH